MGSDETTRRDNQLSCPFYSKLVAVFQGEIKESSTNSLCLLVTLQIDELEKMCDCEDKEDELYFSLVEEWLNYDPNHPKNNLIICAVRYIRELREQLKE